MRVLIYAIDFAPKIGGEETYLLLLGQGLAHRLDRTKKADTKSEQCCLIVATKTSAEGFDDTTLSFPVIRQPGLATLWHLLGETDIVQLSGPVLLPLLLAYLRRKPIVITHHMYHSSCPNGLLLYKASSDVCPGHFAAHRYHECLRCNAVSVGWWKSLCMLLATLLRHWLCERVSANLGVTQHVSQRIALPQRTTINYGIPNSFDACRDHLDGLRAVASINFAYVGRLVKEKGLTLLLEAAQRLRDRGYDFHVIIIGDGPERASLEATTASLSLQERVHFTGFLRGEALGKALVDVAAVVMPSIWEETAGLAAIEQMMRGGLVIASEIGGLAEVVGDAGLKFKAGDVEGLTNCLRQAMDNPTQVIELGRKARERALRLFDQNRMVDQHYKLYEDLLLEEKPVNL